MSKSILRIAKLKSFGNVGAAGSHVFRQRETLNADPARTHMNKQLIGSQDLVANVKARIGDHQPRKNAVLAVDHLLTASPEYFRDKGMKPGQFNVDKTKQWAKKSIAWLKDQYGDNLVSASLHLDESTPHIHAVVVPMHDDKLNAKHYFGGRYKLSKMQDSYHKSVSDLGIDRGVKNSKANHTSIRQLYNATKLQTASHLITKHKVTEPSMMDRMSPIDYAQQQVDQALFIANKKNKVLALKANDVDHHKQRAKTTDEQYIDMHKRLLKAERTIGDLENDVVSAGHKAVNEYKRSQQRQQMQEQQRQQDREIAAQNEAQRLARREQSESYESPSPSMPK